jgi:hypothetical protein
MERSNNAWLEGNRKKLDLIKKQITEISFQDTSVGSAGRKLPLAEIQWLFEGAMTEIFRLQKEVDRLEQSGKQQG